MKFSIAAVFAAATGAFAYPSNVTIVTEIVESYVTYCPSPTMITHGSSTWTVTEATTLTITDCPCTITKPVITSSVVVCNTCTETAPAVVPTTAPVVPSAPVVTYSNVTVAPVPTVPAPAPTGGITLTSPGAPVPTAPEPVPTGGAAKLGFSGLAGLALIAALL